MDVDRLDLRRMKAFQAVATYGSLSAAARVLGQTPPAVSLKIKLLEQDLECRLFERLANKLLLTEDGTRFLADIEDIFSRIKLAVSSLSSQNSLSGHIKVTVGSDHGWYFAPLLSSFLRNNPEVEMSLRVQVAAHALKGLMNGDYDVIVGHFGQLPKSVKKVDLVSSGLSMVTLRGEKPFQIQDLHLRRLITLPRHAETRKLIDKHLDAHHCRPASVIEVANCHTAITFVEEGGGVAIAHSLCVEHFKSDKVDISDLGQIFGKISFAVVHRMDDASSPTVRALVRELCSRTKS